MQIAGSVSVFRSVSVGLSWRFSLEKYHISVARRSCKRGKVYSQTKGHMYFKSAPVYGEKKRRSIGGELQGSFYRITKFYLSLKISLPETKIVPANRPSQKDTAVFQQSIFRCFCCQFQGGYHTFALDHFLNHLYIWLPPESSTNMQHETGNVCLPCRGVLPSFKKVKLSQFFSVL